MGADAVRIQLVNRFLFFILLFCASCAKPDCDSNNIFDGLPKPNSIECFNTNTSDGYDYGVTSKETFLIDIDNDGKEDKIIRGTFSNITAHGYTFYEIYLRDKEIAEFKTTESADCSLTTYKFQFEPFSLTKISRPLGDKSWEQPTKTTIEKFKVSDFGLEKISEKYGPKICDVKELTVK